MIEAYGVYEIKVIDSETNEVKQEIIKKNKLSMQAVLLLSSGNPMIYSGTYLPSNPRITARDKKVKTERLEILSGTTTLAINNMDYQQNTFVGTNPCIITMYKRFAPPVSTKTYATFALYNQNDGGDYSGNLVYGTNANLKAMYRHLISLITLDTPCVQTTTDYLDITYKLSIGYNTSNDLNSVDKVRDYKSLVQYNVRSTSPSNNTLPRFYIDMLQYSVGYTAGPNNDYRDLWLFQNNTKPVRYLTNVNTRSASKQGISGKFSVGNAHRLVDALTYKLAPITMGSSINIGSIFNSCTEQRYVDRDTIYGWQFRDMAFVSNLPINKFHSPVFKHAYGCNGPFQDLNYLGASSGSLTINSTNYTKKDWVPIFRRIDLRGSGNIADTKYSYKDMNICAFPSKDGNYTNTEGYFSLLPNIVSTDDSRIGNGGYLYSNPGIPGLANAYAQGVSGDPYPEWNNNIDDSEQWYRTDFTTNTGTYVLVKRNPWSGETKYSTDNSSLAELSNIKQVAFNTITKDFWIATSTTGLWKVSDNFTTATQIDLSSYNVATAQVYGVCINSTLGIIYIVANGGLLKSEDDGVTWTKYTELEGFSISEFNGVGGNYSNCAKLVCSNLYNTDLLIQATISGTQSKVYRWNGTTISVYNAPADNWKILTLQYTTKLLPNAPISQEEDLVVYGLQDSTDTNRRVYINKFNESLYEIYAKKTPHPLETVLGQQLHYSVSYLNWNANSLVYNILPILVGDNLQYYCGISLEPSADAHCPCHVVFIYNPISNVVTMPYHRDNWVFTPLYPTVEFHNTFSTSLYYGLSVSLKLFNQKTKLGFFVNRRSKTEAGYNNVNFYMAAPQILHGTNKIVRPGAYEMSNYSGLVSVPITMTNGIPRNIGRHLAWREYMWNGSSWVMDEWTPAVDSSTKGNNGTRKFFDHGSRIFNSSSTISVTPDIQITGSAITFAMSIKTDKYSTSAYNNMPIVSIRNTASRLRTGGDNTSFHYLWSCGTTSKLGVQQGYTEYTNTAIATTYATNTWKRVVFVTTGTTTKLYIDGSLIDTFTHSSLTINVYELMLGARYDFRNPTSFFEGEIENFQCWDAEWTQDDVTYDYNHQTGLVSDNLGFTLLNENNLHIHWKLDEDLVSLECRPLHDTAQSIPKKLPDNSIENDGVTIDFDNGTGGTSFVDKESMTFATLNGILKDNATTVTLPNIYQNFTRDEDESNFYMSTVPGAPFVVTQLPIYWIKGGNYTFNQVVGPQGNTNPTASYSQLTFSGDFDFTFEPSCEVYNDTYVGFTTAQLATTPSVKIYLRFTSTSVVAYIDGVTSSALPVHTFGDVYRISRSGSTVAIYRNSTVIYTGTYSGNDLYAYVNFAHASDTYAGISNAIATMTLPAGLVLFGDKVYYLENGVTYQKGIWYDKDYNYSPEYYNLSAHKVTINGVLTTPIADGPNQYSSTIAQIAATAAPGSPAICKYGMIFHSSDYGKTLGGTYRYRYIGI